MYALPFLVFAAAGFTHVNVMNVLEGSWGVAYKLFEDGSTEPICANRTLALESAGSKMLRGTFHGNHTDDYVFTLNFENKGVFVMTDEAKRQVAEFEFFTPIFPHLTASGAWFDDCVFSAHVISSTSAQISVFNHTSRAVEFYVMTKEVAPKGFLETNLVMILSFGMILFKVVRRELTKRQMELEMRKRAEEQEKRFEEEECQAEEQEQEADE